MMTVHVNVRHERRSRNWVDRELQRQRISKAMHFIPAAGRLLDVGCADGRLLALAQSRSSGEISGIGLDTDDSLPWIATGFERTIGPFPMKAMEIGVFDVVTMLAVVEHVREAELPNWGATVYDLLKPGGRLIITMPSPAVDRILDFAIKLKVLDGMDAEAHHGASTTFIGPVFAASGLVLVKHSRFQFGLNNLFVFEKPT
jgi:2-polyprenyl-3-methyl-5-hydroxy-6-metoxy-1,4-benzoquinol methylase